MFYDCSPGDVTGPVGFSATLAGSVTLEQYAAVVPFVDTRSNFGGHFDTKSRSFVCPAHGVYLFMVTLTTFNNQKVLAIYRNDVKLFDGFTDGAGSNDYDSATITAVTECFPGDVVFVMSISASTYLYNTYQVNIFSGILLHRF